MSSKALKLLERMRLSKNNWKRRDLDTLYEGFGFIISEGSKHDIVKHPSFPILRTTLPRHRVLAKGYVEEAIKLVDQLISLEKKEMQNESKADDGSSKTS